LICSFLFLSRTSTDEPEGPPLELKAILFCQLFCPAEVDRLSGHFIFYVILKPGL